MLNPVALLAQQFGAELSETYHHYFGAWRPEYANILDAASSLVIERLGNSNALYHNVDHTVMVTLCGQQIIRGRLLCESLNPEDWVHFIVSLLIHDIGYIRGICSQDTETQFVINEHGDMITPPRGASDAFLAPYHIERGKIFARERFETTTYIDVDRITDMIEMTRFPIPEGSPHNDIHGEGALCRAADLIGQMGDPFYHSKCNGLYAEFVECGTDEVFGYKSPADLIDKYPDFFWDQVKPVIGPAIELLRLTSEGKNWIANLYANLFDAQHKTHHIGPYAGDDC